VLAIFTVCKDRANKPFKGQLQEWRCNDGNNQAYSPKLFFFWKSQGYILTLCRWWRTWTNHRNTELRGKTVTGVLTRRTLTQSLTWRSQKATFLSPGWRNLANKWTNSRIMFIIYVQFVPQFWEMEASSYAYTSNR